MNEESQIKCEKCDFEMDHLGDTKYICLHCIDSSSLLFLASKLFFEAGRRQGISEKLDDVLD